MYYIHRSSGYEKFEMHESNKIHGPACWVCVYIARSSGLGLEMK